MATRRWRKHRRLGSNQPRAVAAQPVRVSGRRPLLVIDGDSFAHRAYHALPKTIRRRGNKGAGAILGFANFLLRLYADEQPRAVLVGWDTLDEPTYRHAALPAIRLEETSMPSLSTSSSCCPRSPRPAALPAPGRRAMRRTTFRRCRSTRGEAWRQGRGGNGGPRRLPAGL